MDYMTFRHPLIVLCIVFLVGIFLCVHELLRMPDGKLHIYFMDVGQADSALTVTPSGKQIIIDGGRDDTPLAEIARHLPLLDRTIDVLILSHPQLDHMFAFPSILRRYHVDRILMTGVEYDLPRYHEFLRLVAEQQIPVWIADPGFDIDFGDGVTADIVWPPPTLLGSAFKDINNSSIVLRVMYGENVTLFTGDMEEKEERAVLASGRDVSATLLKVAHHGSKTSSGTGFLLAVQPNVAAISCGKNNTYGHPHAVVLERFERLRIPVRVTAWEGEIDLEY